jgi:hypothetical protein
VQHEDYFVPLMLEQEVDRDSDWCKVVVDEHVHTKMEHFHVRKLLLTPLDNYLD